MNPNTKKKSSAFAWLLLVSLILVTPSLVWRLAQERTGHSSLILFDLLELHALDAEKGQNRFASLMEAGVSAFFAPECTAEEIGKGVLEKVSVHPLSALSPSIARNFSSSEGTVVVLKDPNYSRLQQDYLTQRFAGGESLEDGQTVYFRIPHSYGQLEKAGVLPDLQSMQYLSLAGVPLVYAPAPSFGSTAEELLNSLDFLCRQFPTIRALCPSGQIAAAYPNTKLLGDFVKERGLLMAQVEFSRQYGSGQQVAAAWPNIVSLHGVDREEVLKRNIIRPIMLNRMFRAAEEREVKLLVLRLDPLRSVATPLQEYCADVKELRSRLDGSKFSHRWPAPAPSGSKIFTFLSAVGLQLMLWLLAARFVERFFDLELFAQKRNLKIILAAALALGAASMFVRIIPRVTGAFAAGLLATEAALTAMEFWKVPVRGAVQAFLLTVCGGLILAGYFSTPLYMYRMSTFSGVKLSLLLPVALVLLIDLHKKEHPESLGEILVRPPLWGELALAGGLLLAAVVMLVRSGNYGFVSNSEVMLRDSLEKLLGARPRTKEFLIGYPSLVIWYYLKRCDLWAHYREVLRLAVTLAYSSAVNSFCHFHSPLTLTILRDFNGWWIGLLLGCAVLFCAVRIGRPLYRRFSPPQV